MKISNFILGLFLVLLIVPVVLGIDPNVGKDTNGGHLIITNVDAKVDGKSDKDLKDDQEIGREAKPGSTVELTFKVGNNFTDADDVEIENVVLTLEVDFDFSDIDEESKEFDIKANDDEKVTIKFDVPFEVDEDTFKILIEAKGNTDDNGSQRVEMDLDLVVDKEKNEVIFTKNALTPSEIKCARTVRLTSTVINLGQDEEEGVVLEVTNAELRVNFKSETFDLSEDPDDDNYDATKMFTFSVPDDVTPGTYAIDSKVTFDEGDKYKTETANLVVTKCEIVEEPAVECETDNDCKRTEVCDKGECVPEEEVVIVQPPVTQPTAPTGQVTGETVTTPTLPATEEKSIFESSGFLIALIVGEVLLVIIAILIIVAVFRKGRE